MAEAVVSVRGVSKVYVPSPTWLRVLIRTSIRNPVTALDDVSLEVRGGEICAVVGPNGAGKSTLFRILTGLTTPTEGSAEIMGHDCAKESHHVRRLVGFMPADERTLWLRHSARENLAFHGRLQGMQKGRLRPAVDEALELVGLSEEGDRIGFALSSGMRARLMLARAILHNPSILILDEPTGSVDPMGSFELLELIRRIARERGHAVLMSSHRLDEIEALHDNVLLLDQGKTVYWGDLNDLRRHWERPRLEILFVDHAAAVTSAGLLRNVDGVEVMTVDNDSVVVKSDVSVGLLLEMLDGQLPVVSGVREKRMRLQELLVTVLGSRGEAREDDR